MDTLSTIRPEGLTLCAGGVGVRSQILKAGSSKNMTDTLLIRRPLRRALQGFMTLLNGDSESIVNRSDRAYVEAIKNAEAAQAPAQGFNRFQRALRRVRHNSQFEASSSSEAPLGFFGGRPVIGESTKINGGVYLGAAPQEAIVVDDRHGSLEKIYSELVVRIAEISLERVVEEEEILPEVVILVLKHLRFSEKEVLAACKREGIQADEKVAIDMFLHEGIGAARHQVLVAGYLLQRLKAGNLLRGHISIDATSDQLAGNDERLVYTSRSGHIFVFDPVKLQKH